MSKEQVFIVKGLAPWYNPMWKGGDKIAKADRFLSHQITCKDIINMGFMFYNCHDLISLDASRSDTSNVEIMCGMFDNCNNLTSVDLSNFNTSKVDDMSYMFMDCSSLTTLDLSSFDTSNVTKMHSMFNGCYDLTTLDLSSFDTSNVTTIWRMFYNCYNLTTIKGVIDMKSCEDCGDMFHNCPKLAGVKIKNPPADFESKTGLSSSQYTVVNE